MVYQPNNNYIEQMLLALEANIEYLRQEGSAQLWVKNGQFLYSVGGLFVYEFILDFFQNIEPDTDVEVRIKDKSANGRIVAIHEKNIQVELDKHVGTAIPEARLVISSYYLLQLLYEKLKSVANGDTRLSDLAEKTFNLKPVHTSLAEDNQIPDPRASDKLNLSQQKALKLAIGSEVSFIWGPPGTGKTQTIAGIIEEFIAQGMSVLLIAHTNIATDGALLGVVEYLGQENNDYRDGKLLREGTVRLPKLTAYKMVIPNYVLEQKGRPVRKEIDELIKRHESISKSSEKSEAIVKHFEKIEALKREEDNILNDVSKREHGIQSTHKALKVLESELTSVVHNIAKCQSFGTLRRLLSGLNLDELVKKKSSLLIQKERENDRISQNVKAVSSLKGKLLRCSQRKVDLEKEVLDEDLRKHQNILESAHAELKGLKEQIDLRKRQLEELSNTLIKEAKVIATTLTKSYSSKIVLNREYDCVILDEASMAPLPALWYASGLAKKKVVIVGDFLQLPPIAKHKVLCQDKTEEEIKKEEVLVDHWLKQDIFEMAGITKAINSDSKPNQLQQLNTQYRMHPDIASIVNSLVYEKKGKQHQLISAEKTKKYGKDLLQKAPLKDAHVGVYDTSTIGPVASKTDSGSYYNLFHAFLSVELAKQAINSGYNDIGVISPFRAQTNLIREVLKDEHLLEVVEANTVHRFQGTQKQIIIFDITTSWPAKLLDDEKEGGDDEKLLNVAFSRAAEKCIIIADVRNVEKRQSDTSLVKGFINHCQTHDFPIISCKDIFPEYVVTDKTERWLGKIYNMRSVHDVDGEADLSQLFDETDFYQNFFHDLLKAEKEVIIVSPFITSHRVTIFMPIFDLMLSKGINIFILTRRPEEHNTSMKYQAKGELECFEELGITVLPRAGRYHRKVAIIDRKVLWEGSLNILSHSGGEEQMRRFVCAKTAEQMMIFLKLDKNVGKIGENKLRRCEFCKEPGAWYWTGKSRYSRRSFTYCLIGSHKEGVKPKSKKEKEKEKKEITALRKVPKKRTSEDVPICPKHGLPMIKRKSRFGEFWGCAKYPICKITHKIP